MPIVAKRVVKLQTHVISVRWSCIAMHHVKRNIDTNIRNIVSDDASSRAT